MKILHVITDSNTHEGISVAALDHISALRERGVEQSVVCRPHDDFLRSLREIEIPVETFDYNKWNKYFVQLATRRRVRRKIKSYAPDVVHCWHERAATFIPKDSGVVSLGWDFGFGDYNLRRDAVCDYYMATRREFVERLREQTGRPDCVFYAHAFGTLPDDAPISREEFGIPEDKPVILMLTRMIPRKGVDILLYAALKVDAFVLLAGDGPELDAYRALARDLGLESRVCFAGWRQDRSALLDLADILAVPSRDDSAPAVMPQAWGRGVPLIASNIYGLREHIEHGVNGMLCEVEDVDGLAKNLQMVLEDAGLRERLVAGGTKTYEAKFSKQAVINNLLNTYEEIIRRGISI